jgi:hypothetical protein
MRTKLVIVAIVVLLLIVVLVSGRSGYTLPDASSNVAPSSNTMTMSDATSNVAPSSNTMTMPVAPSMMADASSDDMMAGPPVPMMADSSPVTGYAAGLNAMPLDKVTLDTLWSKSRAGDRQAQCDFGKMLSSNE